MLNNKALIIIKPDAVRQALIPNILTILNGLDFEKMELRELSLEESRMLYIEHKDKEYFSGLVDWMTKGKSLILVVSDDSVSYGNLIASVRSSVKHIRTLYQTDTRNNAVHGSDSKESGTYESNLFL